MNRNICIFDLDGTLSDGTHRLHLLPKKDLHLTESWSEFNGASIGDSPIQSTIDVANALYRSGMTVIILTGRSDEVKTETMIWLDRYGVKYDSLIMRRASDPVCGAVFGSCAVVVTLSVPCPSAAMPRHALRCRGQGADRQPRPGWAGSSRL